MSKIDSKYSILLEEHKDILDVYWGFEVGEGWFDLISELLVNIKKQKLNKQFKIVQIKEKFGGLRVYVRHGREEVFNLIDEAEKKSYEICETCGKPGKLRLDSWHKVSCDKCHKKR